MARLCADCRPLSLGHGHGHGMDTRSRGVSSGLLSHFHSPYTAKSEVFVYLVQFVMEFEFENENGSRAKEMKTETETDTHIDCLRRL